ncbi:hypothetical protein [Bacteroides sp. 51]|uniref:hypothetical protein n=1 Tax=Bacteroides sp. 51 TaxID=2302938 RepID=UPI0013D27908|nr:hypothetical protein [Bacteroides sp. 51]NDV81333.1 hypothetical protein [Bacteroides sp. 51]
MADGFDIIDMVSSAVESADTGILLCKDNSADGEKENHIVVRTTGVETKDYVNKASVVNVNVFVKRNSNGTTKRSIMKDACRKLEHALKNISIPVGMYWKSRIIWMEPTGGAKEGFDCTNIRLEVITELNR